MHVKPSWAAVADKDAVHRSSHGLLICSEAQAAPGPRLYRRAAPSRPWESRRLVFAALLDAERRRPPLQT